LGSHVRPARDAPLGSFAELSCQKIIFDLQLADLPVQNIDLSLAGRSLGQAAALKNTRGAIQQPLLPIGDLVRMDPELARQFGDRPGPLSLPSTTLALNPALCFFRVRFMSCSCATGAF
jgi:hypothetical protein